MKWPVSTEKFRIVEVSLLIVAMVISPFAYLLYTADDVEGADATMFTVGTTGGVDTLNPFRAVLRNSYTILSLMYESLTSVDSDMMPAPMLASSWDCDESELVWTFVIDDDVYWHDGEQVHADDVAFTYNLILSNPAECSLYIKLLTDVTEVIALNSNTVQITTSVPTADLPYSMIPILPEHLWSNVPSNYLNDVDVLSSAYFPDGPIGSGPFILDDFVYNDYVLMNSWAMYHLGAAKFNTLLFKIFSSPEGMINSLMAGTIDLAYDVPAMNWESLVATPGIGGQSIKSGSIIELGVNCASEEIRANFYKASDNLETTNRSVRQAIAMCVNQTYMVDAILDGHAGVGETLLPETMKYWHLDIPDESELPFDLDAAASLLDAAGYIDFDSDGIRENVTSGVPLEFTIKVRNDETADIAAANLISDCLASIGISAPVVAVSESMLYTYWYSCSLDLFIWGWDFGYKEPFPPSFALSVMTTDQIPESPTDWTAWSDSFYSNSYYDQLYEEQLAETDDAARQDIVYEMQDILYYDSPYVVLWYPYTLVAYNSMIWTNYPDMHENPNMSPAGPWFYLSIEFNEYTGPMDVYAGEDVTVNQGVPVLFSGSAIDPDDSIESLNWTWSFDGPDGSYDMFGQSVVACFYSDGTIDVTLTVTDKDDQSVSDSLVVTVLPDYGNERSMQYRWYDMFNVPFGEWYEKRNNEITWSDSYPYIYDWIDGSLEGNVWTYSNMRLDITGRNMPEINMNENPLFVPNLGTTSGGNVTLDWYFTYGTDAELEILSPIAADNNDGWITIFDGEMILDQTAAMSVLGMPSDQWETFDTWWAANSASVENAWWNYIRSEANDRLDIYCMYEYLLQAFTHQLTAERVGDTVVVNQQIVSWGFEALMTRWLHDAWMDDSEYWFEDFSMHAEIGPESSDIDIDTVVDYAMYAFASSVDGDPCWVWEPVCQDYVTSITHPSAYESYSDKERLSLTPGSERYGEYVPYHNVPGAFNLSEGESLVFEWPAGEQLFLEHAGTDAINEIYESMTCVYSEPMWTDFEGQIFVDPMARILAFVGPIDMWEWSNTQVAHSYLENEWDRVGLMPYGAPFVRFSMSSEILDLPPVAEIIVMPPSGDVSTMFEFYATGCKDDIDPASSLEVRWDWEDDGVWDVDWSTDKIVTHSYSTIGTHTVCLEVRDSSGNTDSASITVDVYDNQAPLTLATCNGSDGLDGWYIGVVEVTLHSMDDSDPDPMTYCRVDGGEWYVYEFPIILQGDMVHLIEYYSVDCYGNDEASKSLEVMIDGTVPVTSYDLSGTWEHFDWYRSPVEVNFSASDGLSGVADTFYILDGDAAQEFSGPFTVEGDGLHTIEFYSVDIAGNTEVAQEFTFGIDAEAPHTEFSMNGTHGGNGWYVSSVTVSLTGEDDASDVSVTYTRIDSGEWSAYSSQIILGDGVHLLEYYSVDFSGNVEPVRSIVVKVDTDKPVVTLDRASGFISTSNMVDITWTCSDEMSGPCSILCQLNSGDPITAMIDGITLTDLTDGEHELVITLYDEANNSQTTTIMFSIETSVFSLNGPVGPWAVIGAIAGIVAVIGAAGYLFVRKTKTK